MRKALIVLSSLLMLAGCGSSHVVKQPLQMSAQPSGTSTPFEARYDVAEIKSSINPEDDVIPEHLLAAIKGHLKAQLAKRGLLAASDAEEVYDVGINVTYYRMRGGFVRYMFGVFAGKDGIDSIVTVKQRGSGQLVGESNVSTFNLTAIGSEDDVARMHAEEIAAFLAGKGGPEKKAQREPSSLAGR
jgi:hypothetical protein